MLSEPAAHSEAFVGFFFPNNVFLSLGSRKRESIKGSLRGYTGAPRPFLHIMSFAASEQSSVNHSP